MNKHRDLKDRAGRWIKNLDGTPIENPTVKAAEAEPVAEPTKKAVSKKKTARKTK